MGVPDAAYRGLADAHFGGHRAGAPMGRVGRLGLRRPANQFLFQLGRNGGLPAGAWRILRQAVPDPSSGIACAIERPFGC